MDDNLYSPDYLINHIEDPKTKYHTAKLLENANKWMKAIKTREDKIAEEVIEERKKTKTEKIMEFFGIKEEEIVKEEPLLGGFRDFLMPIIRNKR